MPNFKQIARSGCFNPPFPYPQPLHRISDPPLLHAPAPLPIIEWLPRPPLSFPQPLPPPPLSLPDSPTSFSSGDTDSDYVDFLGHDLHLVRDTQALAPPPQPFPPPVPAVPPPLPPPANPTSVLDGAVRIAAIQGRFFLSVGTSTLSSLSTLRRKRLPPSPFPITIQPFPL